MYRTVRKNLSICFAVSISLLAVSSVQAQMSAVDFTTAITTVGHGGNSAHTLGWTFSVNSDVSVSALGYYDISGTGLSETHEVGIYDSSSNLLVSTTVAAGTTDPLTGNFRYAAVTPLTLSAGTYTIGGTIGTNASDPVGYAYIGLTTAPGITLSPVGARYTELGSFTNLTIPTLNYGAYPAYIGPNFLLASISAVPEPANAALLAGMGLSAAGFLRSLRKRNKLSASSVL